VGARWGASFRKAQAGSTFAGLRDACQGRSVGAGRPTPAVLKPDGSGAITITPRRATRRSLSLAWRLRGHHQEMRLTAGRSRASPCPAARSRADHASNFILIRCRAP
jgi:hypothetical protein